MSDNEKNKNVSVKAVNEKNKKTTVKDSSEKEKKASVKNTDKPKKTSNSTTKGTTKATTKSATKSTKKDASKNTTESTTKVASKKQTTESKVKNAPKKPEDKPVNKKMDSSKNNEEVKTINKKMKSEQDVEMAEEKLPIDESRYNTVSLKEIREALENRVNKEQKKSIVKDILINCLIAIVMLVFLALIVIGKNNIEISVLEKDVKILTLCFLAIGIIVLEYAYKKDSSKIAMNGIEILAFGASNLCLIYVIKLYFSNLANVVFYIGISIVLYYIIKNIFISIKNVKKYKNENNDIKEIVKKNKKEV